MKTKRHSKILELISRHSIDTQEELLKRLKDEGFQVTQATVSRDIKELRLLKTLSSDGNYKYTTGTKNVGDVKSNFQSLFSSSVLSVDYAQNTIVIKTLSGMAMAVCASFDAVEHESVVGTLAGDDTIFVVVRTAQMAESLVSDLKKIF